MAINRISLKDAVQSQLKRARENDSDIRSNKSISITDSGKSFEDQLQRNNIIASIRDEKSTSIIGNYSDYHQGIRNLYKDDTLPPPSADRKYYTEDQSSAKSSDEVPLYKTLKKGQDVYAKYNPYNKDRVDDYFPAKIVAVVHGGYSSAKYDVIFPGFEALGVKTVSWEHIHLESIRRPEQPLMYVKEVIDNTKASSDVSQSDVIRERLLLIQNMISPDGNTDDRYVANPMSQLEESKINQVNLDSSKQKSDLLVASILERREQLKREEIDRITAENRKIKEEELANDVVLKKDLEQRRERMLQVERERLNSLDGDRAKNLSLQQQEPRHESLVPAPTQLQLEGERPQQQALQEQRRVELTSPTIGANDILNSAITKGARSTGNWRKKN